MTKLIWIDVYIISHKNKMDINSIINKSVDGYLKPKYPIYRITYIHTKFKHNEGGEMYIKTKHKIKLFEYINEDDDIGNRIGIDFEECKVCKNVIDEVEENDYFVIKDEFYANQTWTIIKLEQLA